VSRQDPLNGDHDHAQVQRHRVGAARPVVRRLYLDGLIPMKEIVYLVIGPDRSVRAAKRPRVADNEILIKIALKYPDNWGRVVQTMEIDVPDFTPSAEVVEATTPDDRASDIVDN
jgi:hypothetical protein